MALNTVIFALFSLLATFLLFRGLVLIIRIARPRFPAPPTRRKQLLAGLWWLAAGGGFVIYEGVLFSDVQVHTDQSSVPFELCAMFGLVYFAVILTLWAFGGIRNANHRHCLGCQYDMTGSRQTCPECGYVASSEQELFKPCSRPRARRIVLASFSLLYASILAQRFYLGGLLAAIPNWILIAGMRSFPDSMIVGDGDPNHEDRGLFARTQRGRLFPWERTWVLSRAQPLSIFGRPSEQARMQWFVDQLGPEVVAEVDMKMLRGIASTDHQAREIAAFTDMTKVPIPRAKLPLGEAVRPFESALVAALDDPVKEVRGLAARYLTELGPDSDRYIPLMLRNLTIPYPATINIHSIPDLTSDAIARRAQKSAAVRQQLFDAARGPDALLATKITWILNSPGIFDQGGLELLFELADHQDPNLAVTAVEVIARSKRDSSITLPFVVGCIVTREFGGTLINGLYEYKDEDLLPYVPVFASLLISDDTTARINTINLFTQLYQNNSFDDTLILPLLQSIAAANQGEESNDAQHLVDKILQRTRPDEYP